MDKGEATEVVHAAIDEVNKIKTGKKSQRFSVEHGWYSADPDPPIKKNDDTILVGRGSLVKSIDLIQIVAAVEEQLRMRGIEISMTDDKAFSQSKSPFRTMGSLIMLVEQLA